MKHINNLLKDAYFLTDGGLETSLIYLQGFKLNHFAAFELVESEKGRATLEAYYKPYLDLAVNFQAGFIMETPTWRANPDWAASLGYSHDELIQLNKASVKLVRGMAQGYRGRIPEILISGNIGPRGDGYLAADLMSPAEAENYHLEQVKTFAVSDVDLVTAVTITYSAEALGIVNAARKLQVPVVISFTVETDGRLPSGEPLGEAIVRIDMATDAYPSYYMINCAHPEHFRTILGTDQHWKNRIQGIRANASAKSHKELDELDVIDPGNKYELAADYLQLCRLLPKLQVFGGCCGTDHTHIELIGRSCLPSRSLEKTIKTT